ncbi:DUF3703 domain-containing protein [Shewanella surugensis]|uniref:DUF3703 domain-containing protein n=1 Tax=Shewanella surugensis TaxID=212020 RepID=A0ABT0LHJ4_9GAMM|nr:DUF3703 domain-containing protein [Shewanella surugensis]MCL1127169.1 DUF3703 domain-containing protein [Shewanella surugensis]
MRNKLKVAYNLELGEAIRLYKLNEFTGSFHHLERAHILGQRYIIPHTKSHWWMLKVGIRKHNIKEVFGQVTRMIASVLFSKIWVPLGNTGGANVNPMKPMPIPEDLKKILSESE